MSQRPTLGQLVRDAIEARVADLNVSLPGTVESYNATNNTANVRLSIKRKLRDDLGNSTSEEYPVLADIPVAFMRCALGFITLPLAVGDRVDVRFANVGLGTWKEAMNTLPVEPQDATPHTLSGAYCVPGLYPLREAFTPPASTAHVVIGTSQPTSYVLLGANDVSGSKFVALSDVVTLINSLKSALSAWTPVPSDGGAALKSQLASFLLLPDAAAATKVKAK